jgi:hypothetical protein
LGQTHQNPVREFDAGVPSNSLTGMSPRQSVGRGGMGTLMAKTRFPTLNILDMIYIVLDGGEPGAFGY